MKEADRIALGQPRFALGNAVTSVINPQFVGQVVRTFYDVNGFSYVVSHFSDSGECLSSNFHEFELEPASKNGMGFKK